MTAPTRRRATDCARTLWQTLAGAGVVFPQDDSLQVVVAPDSRLCPPGWLGIVELAGAALVTAPDEATAARATELTRLDPGARTDLVAVGAMLPVVDVLGPARLAYLDAANLTTPEPMPHPDHPQADEIRLDVLTVDDPLLRELLGSVDRAEAEESGIGEITSGAFVARRADQVLAVSGYRTWPAGVAHLCVLTEPTIRSTGLGRRVAHAATRAALAAGLVPQWRARVQPSQRIARSLGYRDLGSQLSVQVG